MNFIHHPELFSKTFISHHYDRSSLQAQWSNKSRCGISRCSTIIVLTCLRGIVGEAVIIIVDLRRSLLQNLDHVIKGA
jgi:hypothetical protein